MSQAENGDALTPVYIPWKTFENYVSGLKGTTIPHQLDGTIRPKSMAGGVWRQLVSAFKFLGYANSEGYVNVERLRALVESHGTDSWKETIRDQIVPMYDAVLKDLPIESATPGQLNKRFQDNAGVDGQMLKKCVRFYLYALRESGVKYSDHLSIRERRAPTTQRKRPRKSTPKPNNGESGGDGETTDQTPKGMIDFKVPFGSEDGLIRVPRNITIEQFPVFSAFVSAVEALAKQNSGEK